MFINLFFFYGIFFKQIIDERNKKEGKIKA